MKNKISNENEKNAKIEYVAEKTNLRCPNCRKKIKKRIYSNGKVSYICENCGW